MKKGVSITPFFCIWNQMRLVPPWYTRGVPDFVRLLALFTLSRMSAIDPNWPCQSTRCCATDARPHRDLLARVVPVLQLERRHTNEFRHGVGHQYQVFAACVTCNLQVSHTDGLAEFFPGGTNGAKVLRGLGAVRENFVSATFFL